MNPEEMLVKWKLSSIPTLNWKEATNPYDDEIEDDFRRPRLLLHKKKKVSKTKKPFEVKIQLPNVNVPEEFRIPQGYLYFADNSEEYIFYLYEIFQSPMGLYVLSQITQDGFIDLEKLNEIGIPAFNKDHYCKIRNAFFQEQKEAYILWYVLNVRTYKMADPLLKFATWNTNKNHKSFHLHFCMLREPDKAQNMLMAMTFDF